MKVVCDSSVLIGLAKIGKVELLKEIYSEVFVPEAVFVEVVGKGKVRSGVREVEAAK